MGLRFAAIAAIGALAVTAGLSSMSAQAVHDEDFILGGNVDESGTDWEDLFTVTGPPGSTTTTPKATANLPANVTAATFAKDFVLPDTTGYATGAKDTLPISVAGTGDWQCKTPNNLGSKFDLVNAYAAAYVIPETAPVAADRGDLIVYFGSEVSAPEGNRNMGVWLLQDGNVACSGAGNTDFSGSHVDGDVFVVSAFTNGGSVANIDVYEWDVPNAAVNDPDIFGSLVPVASFSNARCPVPTTALTDDRACAIANTDGDKNVDELAFEVDPPWDAPDKNGDNIGEAQFMEGGVNLTDLGLSGCFPTFLANSRSSQVPGSTLHDFARSSFQQCGATLVTTPSDSSIVLGGTITDTATVTVSGPNPPAPTGDVTFSVCGPTSGLNGCTSTDTTRVAVGTTKSLTNATRSGAAYSVTSDAFTPTAAGRYCFRATWPGDSTYTQTGGYADGSTTECFDVIQLQPTIGTAQSFYPNDSATITVASGAGALTGSVRFRLYNSSADCLSAATGHLYDSGSLDVADGTGTALSKTVSTDNRTVAVSATVTLWWLVQFTSTNNGINNVTSNCIETSDLEIDNDTTTP